jgi:hypothetical protein
MPVNVTYALQVSRPSDTTAMRPLDPALLKRVKIFRLVWR